MDDRWPTTDDPPRSSAVGRLSSASIAAAVLARDEAQLLEGCLLALQWVDELLVIVDPASRDGTLDIAKRHASRIDVVAFHGFSRQRNRALDVAAADWVLFVDADERVLPALASEIRATLAQDTHPAGFWIPRRNLICGRWVRHAGWWPDRQLRLLRRESARYDESVLVHEVAQLQTAAGLLTEPLLHLNYRSLAEFRAKQARYASLEARALSGRGVHARPRNLVLQPLREFRRRFFDLSGYREGWLGLELSLLMALATYETYRELLRLRCQPSRQSSSGGELGS